MTAREISALEKLSPGGGIEMLLGFFLNSVFLHPTKPAGWEKRTDAAPYLAATTNAPPVLALPLKEGQSAIPGWDVHVRVAPNQNADDWRARLSVTSIPMTFRTHARVWPSDDWVYYQMLGRVNAPTPGDYKFGLSFITGNAAVGCFSDLRVGGASVVQVNTASFFSKRAPKSSDKDELMFDGRIKLEQGDYDVVVTLGCHPGKMGTEIDRRGLGAWKDSRFMVVMQKPGQSMALLRSTEVSHIR